LTRGKPALAVTWAVIACLFLGSSWVVRALQDRRHKEESSWVETCPFPLKEIPRTLGHWVASSEDQKLDSQTMLITGGTDHVIRTYSDDSTGVRLVVLILFGPVEPVIPHVPEICYPANGFKKLEEPINRTIQYSCEDCPDKPKDKSEASAIFRSSVYQKGRIHEGVYHSFRYNGEWSPDVGGGKKLPRRNPGVFKVQIQRLMVPNESRDIDKYPDPIEDFLKSLLPVIDRESSRGTAKEASKNLTPTSTRPALSE
jgi:hypothetical protein